MALSAGLMVFLGTAGAAAQTATDKKTQTSGLAPMPAPVISPAATLAPAPAQAPAPTAAAATAATVPQVLGGNYQVFAFNDLGMHCYDADFSVFSVLPPYNVLRAQVIKRGSSPQLLDSGIYLKYSAVADPTGSINSTSVGKSNFWTYVQKLFGVALASDTGLKGFKMPGTANTPQTLSLFDSTKHWFSAEGIPITAWDNALKRNTMPLMRVSTATTGTTTVLSTLDTVVPASDEMNCSNCHVTGGLAANQATATKYAIRTAWSTNANKGIQAKENILILHDGAEHTNLNASRPVLCASCHYSAALDLNKVGPQGNQVGKPYLSRAMHTRHGETVAGGLPDATHPAIVTGTTTSACYNCHPGTTTQCLRGAMATAGINCENCHGGMLAVGGYYPLKTTGKARQPWIDLPKCQSCHTGDAVSHLGTSLIATTAYSPSDPAATPITATNQRFGENANTTYRNSLGHNNVACESCHGSPHAEWPAKAGSNDNLAAQQIQGHTGPIIECTVCHGTGLSRTTNGPHGLHNINASTWYNGGHEGSAGGNNCKTCHGTDGLGTSLSKAAANRTFSVEGRTISVAAGKPIGCNLCHRNYINGGG